MYSIATILGTLSPISLILFLIRAIVLEYSGIGGLWPPIPIKDDILIISYIFPALLVRYWAYFMNEIIISKKSERTQGFPRGVG